ncbi:hypothetical protein [Dinghuibacter silviterrae]|uniref:Uncharacterized protein n=1 Tax=Dinghuibacter silviterrae TaxID=1539049 RepID=A0A4R8DFE1_9BACT|nr:hypothetical protein [Dinghuibacter silviterrae]TDW96301.1 hypothetical protein EDB95_4127 [Dinghuibacter silviterrae]
MNAATIHDLKKELATLPPAELVEACLRLAKYKKENKELLTFLLFEAHDLTGYMEGAKVEIREQLKEVNTQPYLMKKTLRKVLRTTNKHIRYAASKEVEVELLLFFCKQIRADKIPIHRSTQMVNLFAQQLKKIRKALEGLHEDLQYDYERQLRILEE